jgi:NTE family protein
MGRLNKDWCLVLSGGGAKGVYHLGVWKALKELDIEVNAIVGTSIGALAAALLAQGADDALEVLVGSLSLDSIVALPPELFRDGRWTLDRGAWSAARSMLTAAVDRGGLDTSPLRRLLDERIDEAAIRRSGVDLGLVTVNLTDLAPRQVFLDAIAPGQLVDYLMASSAFPGFEMPVIDGKRYLDGGLYDNIPYALARDRGYRRIIVSDIAGPGRNRRFDGTGAVTAFIRASIRMGGAFDFDREFLDSFQTLGKLDALRCFGALEGQTYFLEPGASTREADRALEAAASVLEVPRIARYTRAELEAQLTLRRTEAEGVVERLLGGSGQLDLRALVSEGAWEAFQGGPYVLSRLLEELFPGRAGRTLRRSLARLNPGLEAGAAFLNPLRQ